MEGFFSQYKKILVNILWFGLLLFFSGIYVFPNDSGTQQTFYLLVVVPFLFIFPFVLNDIPWSNKYLYLYLAFPMYMFASYFWAPDENVTRPWTFFFRQLACFFVFIISLILVLEKFPKFPTQTLWVLIVVGFFSAIASVVDYVMTYDDIFVRSLFGFSIVDRDKAGSIYALHLGFCFFAAANELKKNISRKIFVFLVIAVLIDFITVYLTGTLGNLIIVALVPIIYIALELKGRNRFLYFIFLVFLIFIVGILIAWKYEIILNDLNISVRIQGFMVVFNQWRENTLFGSGLVYKSALKLPESSIVLVHPHNMFLDTLRYGGVSGLFLLICQIVVPAATIFSKKAHGFEYQILLFWCISGVISSCFYGQQPYVRPGSYMWFLYWIPISLMFASTIYLKFLQRNSVRI